MADYVAAGKAATLTQLEAKLQKAIKLQEDHVKAIKVGQISELQRI